MAPGRGAASRYRIARPRLRPTASHGAAVMAPAPVPGARAGTPLEVAPSAEPEVLGPLEVLAAPPRSRRHRAATPSCRGSRAGAARGCRRAGPRPTDARVTSPARRFTSRRSTRSGATSRMSGRRRAYPPSWIAVSSGSGFPVFQSTSTSRSLSRPVAEVGRRVDGRALELEGADVLDQDPALAAACAGCPRGRKPVELRRHRHTWSRRICQAWSAHRDGVLVLEEGDRFLAAARGIPRDERTATPRASAGRCPRSGAPRTAASPAWSARRTSSTAEVHRAPGPALPPRQLLPGRTGAGRPAAHCSPSRPRRRSSGSSIGGGTHRACPRGNATRRKRWRDPPSRQSYSIGPPELTRRARFWYQDRRWALRGLPARPLIEARVATHRENA